MLFTLAFGVRRLVAALESVFWTRNGGLLPFSGETNVWFQGRRGNPGSKLPVWDSIRLLKAATSRRTPNVPSAPCVKSYAALGGTPALHWTFLPGEQEFEIGIAHPVPGYLKYGYR